MGIEDATQRPLRHQVMALQRLRTQQLTIKIKTYAHRPNLLGEVPQRNTIGVGQGGSVRLAGGDVPVGSTSETDWYYPSTSGFSANATNASLTGEESVGQAGEKYVEPIVSMDRESDRCGF